ncbi:hypothetical protein [Flavobacterium piscisymbiosum]|nr:hypothetical protein [Flavobacterium sp. F-30]
MAFCINGITYFATSVKAYNIHPESEDQDSYFYYYDDYDQYDYEK